MAEITDLIGKTLTDIENKGDEIYFTASDGSRWRMLHRQDCCESVSVEDIAGDLSDLIGSPILQAEEVSSDDNPPDVKPPEYQDSFTWTFYKFATAKGYVTIRWYGESNGYYSERVDFESIEPVAYVALPPVEFFRDADGRLTLYKAFAGLYDATPAEPNDSAVCVKGIVHTEPQGALVSIPVTRELFTWEGLEDRLVVAAHLAAGRFQRGRQFQLCADQMLLRLHGIGRDVAEVFVGERLAQNRAER